ncbi:MAG: hypothetical protein WC464_04455 [Bdellovibrionales bacterium]
MLRREEIAENILYDGWVNAFDPEVMAKCKSDVIGRDTVFTGFEGNPALRDIALCFFLSNQIGIRKKFLNTVLIEDEPSIFRMFTEEQILSEPRITGNRVYVSEYTVISDPDLHLKYIVEHSPPTSTYYYFSDRGINCPIQPRLT